MDESPTVRMKVERGYIYKVEALNLGAGYPIVSKEII